VPPEALNTISMLTEDEKRFLYWCTSRFYENKGEIVELGPFAGGSSVALAAGLRASWPEANRTVQVYDRFKTDDWTWPTWTFADGTTLTQNPSQKINFLGVSYYYKFQ